MAIKNFSSQFLQLLFLIVTSSLVSSQTETDVLLEFKSSLSYSRSEDPLRSWNSGSNPCKNDKSTWTGVTCLNNQVWKLQLENMGLVGPLDLTTLSNLPSLRAISFKNNRLTGPMPNISKLGVLKVLYLSNNNFSGVIPDDAFSEMRSLKTVYISGNQFGGNIPSSLAQISKLLDLGLDSNEFEGEIPDFGKAVGLQMINVSHNDLEGIIPDSLKNMNQSLFAGNKNLCGAPLNAICPSHKKSRAILVDIIVASIFASLIILCIIFSLIRCCRSKRIDSKSIDIVSEESSISSEISISSNINKVFAEKLSFIKEEEEKFDMQELLKASAEILGNGNFGFSYKAVLKSAPSVVVKRYKDMNKVGRDGFQEHMKRLGKLNHANVLPILAYCYRKEEKLILSRYIVNKSLAHILHGNSGTNLTPLEWPKRLKIIKGVARGLVYLHEELSMLTLPHGHLKSSNVLINENYEPLLTDYALIPVVNHTLASKYLVAYKSPEVNRMIQPSKKSDVWSFGILIIEILTGKLPPTYLQNGTAGADLGEWVKSVVKKGGETFDSKLEMKNGESEMLKLLEIGLKCCEVDMDKRMEMNEVIVKIEWLKEISGDNGIEDSSFLSEVDLYSSTDYFSFS